MYVSVSYGWIWMYIPIMHPPTKCIGAPTDLYSEKDSFGKRIIEYLLNTLKTDVTKFNLCNVVKTSSPLDNSNRENITCIFA